MRQWCIGNWSFPSFRLAHFLILISCTKSECSRKQVQFIYRAATDLLRAWGIIGRFWYKKNCSKIISWAGSIGLKNCVGVVALFHRRCDSSVGRALDWRSKGPVFDPRLRHCFFVCIIRNEDPIATSLVGQDWRRGCSSNGRASALHAEGTGIDTLLLHISFEAFILVAIICAFCWMTKRDVLELNQRPIGLQPIALPLS